MWVWLPLWFSCTSLAASIGLLAAGLRPDQPPQPFAGTPWMGTDILIVLLAINSICIVLHVILYERSPRKPRVKGESS